MGSLKGIVTEARIVELFDHLDHDGNGELSQEEFVGGMLMVAFSDVPVETKQMLHLQQLARVQLQLVEKYLHHISRAIDQHYGSAWRRSIVHRHSRSSHAFDKSQLQ